MKGRLRVKAGTKQQMRSKRSKPQKNSSARAGPYASYPRCPALTLALFILPESVMEDDDGDVTTSLTYAARNPQKEIIPPRANTQPKRTDSQLRATQIRQAQACLDAEMFHEDVSNHLV